MGSERLFNTLDRIGDRNIGCGLFAIYVTSMGGPLVIGMGLETAGQLTQNPELVSSGREWITLQAKIWVGYFGLIGAGLSLKEVAGIPKVQKEIQSIPRRLRQLNSIVF